MDANTVHNEMLVALKNKKVLKSCGRRYSPFEHIIIIYHYYIMHIIPFFKSINFHFNERKSLQCKLCLNDLTVKD